MVYLLYSLQVRASSLAVQAGDFNLAVQLYTSALNLDPGNHILYSNRAAAYIHLRQYKVAVRDAKTARTLNPKWIKVSLCFFICAYSIYVFWTPM